MELAPITPCLHHPVHNSPAVILQLNIAQSKACGLHIVCFYVGDTISSTPDNNLVSEILGINRQA